jgi:hypothetical protein
MAETALSEAKAEYYRYYARALRPRGPQGPFPQRMLVSAPRGELDLEVTEETTWREVLGPFSSA